jgi:hypothetical protein
MFTDVSKERTAVAIRVEEQMVYSLQWPLVCRSKGTADTYRRVGKVATRWILPDDCTCAAWDYCSRLVFARPLAGRPQGSRRHCNSGIKDRKASSNTVERREVERKKKQSKAVPVTGR